MPLKLQYKITDITTKFYDKAVEDMKERLKKINQILEMYNKETNLIKPKPVEKEDPISGELFEFPYPLAKDIWVLFNFVTSTMIGDIDVVKTSLANLQSFFYDNALLDDINYKIDRQSFVNTRPGYLSYMADLKLKLLSGKSFSAQETGIMMGITGQAIRNRISRDSDWLEAEKIGNRFVIDNATAKKLVQESDSPFLGQAKFRLGTASRAENIRNLKTS